MKKDGKSHSDAATAAERTGRDKRAEHRKKTNIDRRSEPVSPSQSRKADCRECTICSHPRVREIEDSLTRAVSLRQIERRFGVSRAAAGRHSKNHMGVDPKMRGRRLPAVSAPAAEPEPTANLPVLDQIRLVCADARRLIGRAERGGNLVAANGALRNLTTALELLSRLTGELEQPPAAVFNFQLIDSFVRKHEAKVTAAIETKEPEN